ncbi:hypothetical protein VTI74DRAFT_2958 [Chaetomium olivicolor]
MPTPSRASAPSASSPLRVFSKHPRLTVAGVLLVGTGLGFRHVASTLAKNELAQKNSAASSFYVTVERSGGGI